MLSYYTCLLLVLIGHFGLHLTFYNRVNATGLKRRHIKVLGRLAALECVAFPIVILICFDSESVWPFALQAYGYVCVSAIVLLGIPWLVFRPIFGRDWIAVERTVQNFDVAAQTQKPIFGSLRSRVNARLPLNQISQLTVEYKQLPVFGLPENLVGLKIAHFSDVHLTGDMLPPFYRFVSDQIVAWSPDVVCLTGDIVDKAVCIDWLPECFSTIEAPGGCYFILGNHDTRIVDTSLIRREMQTLGWTDVGSKVIDVTIGDCAIQIAGNEVPWFGSAPEFDVLPDDAFRIALSHSPDQIRWAQRQQVHLMLAGHTHGGHGRLPLAGPLLSPSYYGSRFASGEFFLSPTTMHVTRGLFGTHMQRINCRPELSLLTLSRYTDTKHS